MNYEDISYISPERTIFKRARGGFLSLQLDDRLYPRVDLYMAFPFTHAREYISVRKPSGEEIGFIRRLDDFPKETVDLLEEELKKRYFIPKILKIEKLKEELGEYRWEVKTDSGVTIFNTMRGHGNITLIKDDRVLIKDKFGNRYEIPNLKDVEGKYRKIIESLLS